MGHGLLTLFLGMAIGSQTFQVEATVRRVDVASRRVAFTSGGVDRSATLGDGATIRDGQGAALPGGLGSKELGPGAVVMLTIERVGNRPVIRAIRLGKPAAGPVPARGEVVAQQDTSNLTPIPELGTRTYQGFPGGLYPGGKNTRPESHDAVGRAREAAIRPLDAQGRPDDRGKVVFLGIGFSNTVQAFAGLIQVAAKDAEVSPELVLVNGAVGGMSAEMIQDPEKGRGAQYWATVDERLKGASVTREQVQVVWVKETNPGPHSGSFPGYVKDLQAQLANIIRVLPRRFPNVRLVYLSSRTYGGWAKRKANGSPPGNSEPFSYESGFAVKWLVERQIEGDPALNLDPAKGPVVAPWLSWAAYLWANGTSPRADGVRFSLDDFRENDRMHESPAGQLKVGGLLLRFFKTDPTARPWFVRRGKSSPTSPAKATGRQST